MSEEWDPTHSKYCRICFEDECNEYLISPCKCKGSIKFVHSSCLSEWVFSKNSIKPLTTVFQLLWETLAPNLLRKRSEIKCDICLHQLKYSTQTSFGKNSNRVRTLMIITTLMSFCITIILIMVSSIVSNGLFWYISQYSTSWHPSLAFVDFDPHYAQAIANIRRTTPRLRTIYEKDLQVCKSLNILSSHTNPQLIYNLAQYRNKNFKSQWTPFWSYRFSFDGFVSVLATLPVFLDNMYFGLYSVPLILVLFDFSWTAFLHELISCSVFLYGQLSMIKTLMYMYASFKRIDPSTESIIGYFFSFKFFPSQLMNAIITLCMTSFILYKILKVSELFQILFIKIGSFINKRFPYLINDQPMSHYRVSFFDLDHKIN
jgi:hypothetical protein